MHSSTAVLASLPQAAREEFVRSLSPAEAEALQYCWRAWARPKQVAPVGDWSTWLVCAGRGYGKALALDVEIPTPDGWTTMGHVTVGDTVFDETGKPCRVTFATDVMHGRECYEVAFDDGTVIVADAEHQWLTWDHAARKSAGRRITRSPKIRVPPQCKPSTGPRIVTTSEIRETLLYAGRERNHAVQVAAPVQCVARNLPIPPYALGAWLGDGDSRDAMLTSADSQILDELRAEGLHIGAPKGDPSSKARRYLIGGAPRSRNAKSGRMQANGSLHSRLRELGLLLNKHIPKEFLRASIDQRLALLQGLMDTDGHVSKGGHAEFCSTSRRLADGAFELCASLGFKPALVEDRARLRGKDCGPRYRVKFTPHQRVFRLSRKVARQHTGKRQAQRTHRRYIVEVRPVASVPVRCIQVDSPSHLFLASRAFIPTHNTRVGAEWIRELVEADGRYSLLRVALVGRTAADVRDTMLEGESGLLSISPPWNKPKYIPSKRLVLWRNGARATCYSAEEPNLLRGPQHHVCWADEIAAWQYPETWDQIQFGLRLRHRNGRQPQAIVTTTPRPTKLVRSLIANAHTTITKGSTRENEANLAQSFLEQIVARYHGTRLGRQELDAEILDDNPGALWKRETIDRLRIRYVPGGDGELRLACPELSRIVIAVDPAVTSRGRSEDSDEGRGGRRSNETGIIVGGTGAEDQHGYILEDLSGRYTPSEWANVVAEAYHRHEADAVVAEVNQGGDLVEANIRTVDPAINVVQVRATRGKHVRAEPVAALYEQGKIHHVGVHAILEDQMSSWDPADSSEESPDRVDALVWGLTDLIVVDGPPMPIRAPRAYASRWGDRARGY